MRANNDTITVSVVDGQSVLKERDQLITYNVDTTVAFMKIILGDSKHIAFDINRSDHTDGSKYSSIAYTSDNVNEDGSWKNVSLHFIVRAGEGCVDALDRIDEIMTKDFEETRKVT